MSNIVAASAEFLHENKINVILDGIGYNLVALPSRIVFSLFFSSPYVWPNRRRKYRVIKGRGIKGITVQFWFCPDHLFRFWFGALSY